ncbi:hypothetical protein Daus18300_000559 [Diaporthe australafricana]|uniref:Heterokaryon incompatibility domain-containing protein n=1 Tax=Diaporthe australafricana TaxID=127596 RepID=A0ABR3Y3N2_9PEZI
MCSSVPAPPFVSSIPIEGPVGDLEPVSFHTQTQEIMVEICQFFALQQTRQQGTTPFDFIAEAAMLFLHDPETGLEAMKKRLEATAKLDHTKSPEVEANHNDTEPISADLSGCYSSLYYLALQIINGAIARCLEVFDGVGTERPTQLRRSEIPWNNTIERRAEFLRTLFTRAETQKRLSEEDIGLPNVVQPCDNPSFCYKERLTSSLGEEFKVRGSLYFALKTQRRPDTAREIWIDALCINQADNEERTGQVKLMQRIYAVSSKTTIWLGDDVPEVEEDFPFDDMDKPLHDWLDEPMVDENDLPSTLDFCRKLTANLTAGLKEDAHGRLSGKEGDKAADRFRILSRRAMEHNVSPAHTFVERTAREFVTKHDGTFPMDQWFFGKTALASSECGSKQSEGYLWAGKLMAAMVSLCRCVAVVLSHSWWERMWVIQESYLPRAPPDFYFKGSLFSWKDLVDAIDVCKELIVATNYSYLVTPQEELDLLSVSEVFGKTTPQAATNSADFASLVKRFGFLGDRKGISGSRQPWPSWVLDFDYSDAEQRRVDDAVVEYPTFEGALFSAANAIGDSWTPQEYRASGNVFFTPKILYCCEMCIPTGDAFSIQLPAPSADDDPQWYGFRNIFREDFKASLGPYLGEPHLENPMIKHMLMGAPFPDFSALNVNGSDLDSSDDDEPGPWGRSSGKPRPWRKVPSLLRPKRSSPPTPEDTTDGSAALDADRSVSNELGNSWLRGFNELWSLGYNRSERAVWSIADPNRPPIVSLSSRGWECEGKHAIFLDTGLSALSSVAYEKGDVFAMLWDRRVPASSPGGQGR